MDVSDCCPICGRARPAGARKGICPLCQVRLVLGGENPSPHPFIEPAAEASPPVVERESPEPTGFAPRLRVVEPPPGGAEPSAWRRPFDAIRGRLTRPLRSPDAGRPVGQVRGLRARTREAGRWLKGWGSAPGPWALRAGIDLRRLWERIGREGQKRWVVAAALGAFAMAAGPGVAVWHWLREGRAPGAGVAVAVRGPIRQRPAGGALAPKRREAPPAPPRRKGAPPAATVPEAEQVASLEPAGANDQECAAEEADRRLLARAADARRFGPDDPDGTARESAYAGAFRESGIDPDALSPAAAGARVRSRPPAVAAELAAALDDWASVRQGRGDRDGANRLTEAARVADPDPWRDRLRSALVATDRAAGLSGLLALARSTPVAEVPAASIDLLGRSLADLGDLPAAEAVLRLAQQRHPADAWVNHDLAGALVRLGRLDEAIRFDTAARSIRPESAHALAHTLARAGETDDAVAVFRELVRRRPGDPRPLACLGRALKDAGRAEEAGVVLDAAVSAYREAVRRAPDDPLARDGLGLTLMARGRAAEAAAEFREAVRLKPDFARAHLDLGVALKEQGRPDAAVAEFQLSALLQPGFAEARRRLGDALSAGGQFEASAAEYREAVRAQPDDVPTRDALGGALIASGRFDEAVSAYREAVRARPDVAMLHNRLGVLLFDRKRDVAGAVAEFREAVRLQPDLAEAHFNLGNALKAQGRVVEALTETREAIRIKPGYAEAHVNIGLLLRGVGRLDDAIASYREAIRLKPDLAEAHLCLGHALTSRGDLAAAADAYRELVRLKPDDPEFRRLLEPDQRTQGAADGSLRKIGTRPGTGDGGRQE